MKKTLLKFCVINILISICLFVIYRILLAESKNPADENFLQVILSILSILLQLGFSLVYLIGMIVCSFILFLNLFEKIRNNYFFSLLSFLGLPSLCIIILLIAAIADIYSFNQSILLKFIGFSLIYLVFTGIQFLMFRKKLKTGALKMSQ